MDQILYIFDPLCGWCYGFSDNMLSFYKKYSQNHEFVPVVGGMVTGSRVAPYSQIADYIKNSLPRLEVTTGTTFGDAYKQNFLEDSEVMTNSEPPSKALVTFRTFLPDRAIEYADQLQSAHFKDGRDYNDESLYGELAAGLGLDQGAFMERYQTPEIQQNMLEEFAWVKESGVQGFPTVVYRSGSKYYLISHGYATLETLENSLQKAITMVA